MEHWDQAWAGLKDVPDGPLKQAADSALVNQAHLLASLGRLDDLRVLFKEQVGRTFQNDFLSMMWGRTREAAFHMGRRPEIAYKCGVYALNNVAKELTGRNVGSIALLPSSLQGFTLAQLQEIATRHQLPLRAAFRVEGEALALPCVVHWKQNHFAAILREQGDKVKVADPTFGDDSSLKPEAVNEECNEPLLVVATGG